MITVDYHNINLYRIEEFAVLLKINRYNVIAMLRGKTYGTLAVATMNGYCAVWVLESDNLITGQRTTVLATVVR